MLLDFLQTTVKHRRRLKLPSLLRLLAGLGFFGLFAIAIVDVSFIPLPIPACTDLLLIVLAARQHSWTLLVLVSTAGSVIGGYINYRVGAAGGIHMLEKRVSKKYFALICDWMQHHTFLAVVIPAMLPPPMPLSLFLLAAGALKISQKKFLLVFTLSRAARYGVCVWIGVKYGSRVLRTWDRFSAKWGERIEIVLWVVIVGGLAYAVWFLWSHARSDRKLQEESVWKALAEDV
jgi:membrane protein YqaA with SNARE-associated domain